MIVTTGGRGFSDSSGYRDLALELGRDQQHLVVGERLRRRLHGAEVHQQLDDLRHCHTERLRKVPQRDARLDRDGPARRRDLARLARRPFGAVAAGALALPLAGPAAALVDDDAAPALGAASARSDRSIGLTVGH